MLSLAQVREETEHPWSMMNYFLFSIPPTQSLFVLKLSINIHKSTFNWMYRWNLKLKEKKQQVHFFKAFRCVSELCSIHIHETCLSFAPYRQPRLSINSSRRCSRDENARERSWQFWPWTVLLFCYRMSYWNFGSVVRTYLRIYVQHLKLEILNIYIYIYIYPYTRVKQW